MSRRTRLGLLLLLVAVAALGLPAAVEGNRQADACDEHAPLGAQLRLENGVMKVYEVLFVHERRDYYFCFRRSGEVDQLNDSAEGDYVYRPPRMRIAGYLIAFVGDAWGDAEEESQVGTDVVVSDLRRQETGKGTRSARAGTDPYARVGSVVLRANGAFAWISCPNSNPNRFIASPRPDCVKPGRVNSVYRVRSRRTRRELLARGRGIDPGSLRLSGSRIAWKRNGKTRRARLR